jgi:ubiquinone/menaquinone biosynthesis C-methylase UbiE
VKDQIKAEDLFNIYADRKSHHSSIIKEQWDYSKTKENLFYNLQLKKITDFTKPGRLLDIGCSNGSFVHAAQNYGWDACGIELEAESCKIAAKHGVNVYHNELIKQAFPDEYFTAITMWSILEHLWNPKEILGEVMRILKPGGILAVCVPNIQSIGWKLLKEEWNCIEPQVHLNLFNPKNLEKFMQQFGLKTKYIETLDIKPATIKNYFKRLKGKATDDVTSVAQMSSQSKSFLQLKFLLRLRLLTNIPLKLLGIGEDIYGYFIK